MNLSLIRFLRAAILFSGANLIAQNEPVILEAEIAPLILTFNYYKWRCHFCCSNHPFQKNHQPGNAAKAITFSVTFPEAGLYDLFTRLNVGAGAANDDSFYYGNGFVTEDVSADDDWTRVNKMGTGGYTLSSQVVDGGGGAITEDQFI